MDHEETIFEQALNLESREAREKFLRDRCAGDDARLARLQGLLRAHDRAGKFLEHKRAVDAESGSISPTSPTVPVSLPAAEKSGDRIGRYKLLQKIGEGGCG